jgi:hypothetical protein
MKSILPGNYIAPLEGYNDEGVQAIPGALFFQKVGYATVPVGSANQVTVLEVTVPSTLASQEPDANLPSLIIPGGTTNPSYLYKMGIRVPRFFRGTATDIIKVADDLSTTSVPSITAEAADAPNGWPYAGYRPASASTFTFPPGSPVTLTTDTTYRVYCADNTGIAAGTGIYADAIDRENVIIVELCYYRFASVPSTESLRLDNLTEKYTFTP